MPRIALAFAYDGTRFDSYARQPGRRTVEGELVALLVDGGVFTDARPARFGSGSRTDKDVSAAWNVVAFDSAKPARAVVALANHAPEGLHPLTAAPVGDGFDPRRASRRVYRYRLDGPWPWRRLGAVARLFEGEHDYSNFRRADGDRPPVARIDRIQYLPGGPSAALEFEAPYFLWQQVRRIVAALDGVRTRRFTRKDVQEALLQPGTRRDLGLAPAAPLVLAVVEHQGLAWPPVPAFVAERLDAEAAATRSRAEWLTLVRRKGPPRRR